MLETPHVAVGVAIASKIPNPIISIPMAFASHFVLDRIPHWNPHTFTETQKYGYPKKKTFAIAIADVTIALAFGLTFAFTQPDLNSSLIILACSFASVLPDVVKYPYFLFKKLRKGILERYVLIEREFQVDASSFLYGATTQIITIALAIYTIIG